MLALLKETSKNLISFFKNPTDRLSPIRNIPGKIKILFSVLAIDIMVVTAISPIFYVIQLTGIVDMENHAVAKLMRSLSIWEFIVFGVLLAPLIEELIFRTFLRYKRNYPLKLVVVVVGALGFSNKAKVNDAVRHAWRKYYRLIFYFTALVFAYIHIVNFEISTAILLLSPLLVLPQFMAGFFLGYLRVKFGWLWGYLLHGLHNLVFLFITLLFMGGAVEKMAVKTAAYSLKIEEPGLIQPEESSFSYGKSTVTFTKSKMKTVLAFLLDKEEKLLEFNPPDKAGFLVNIDFGNFTDTLNRKQIILKSLQDIYNFKIHREKRLQKCFVLQISDSLALKRNINVLN